MKEEDGSRQFRSQSYFRLLSYVRPYWKRLTVGILAGMLVGGSLFVTLMLIPQMVGMVEPGKRQRDAVQRQAAAVAAALDRNRGADRTAVIAEVLSPHDEIDPQLASMLRQAGDAAERYHLPVTVEGRRVRISWPAEFTFDAVNAAGQVAWQLLAVYVVFFMLVWLLKNVAHYINVYCTRYVGARVVADLRDQIFRKLMSQSLGFYGRMDIGQLISRCNNDTAALEHSVSNCVEELTNAPLQLLGCACAIFIACRQYDNYLLLLILAVGGPLLFLPLQLLGRKIRKLYRRTYARVAVVVSRMHEAFFGIKVVKAYYMEEAECQRFHQTNRRYFKEVIRAMRLQVLVSPAMELIAVAASLVFLVYSYGHGVSFTQLSALLAPAMMAYRPLKDISKVVATIQQSMAAADRFFDLIDTDTSLPEKPQAYELTGLTDGIEVRDVSFRYEDQTIIDHLSFRIGRGQVVAVVGETGSGKTTLANLIARFYDVTSGAVLIDGHDVRDCSIAGLRRLIGVVNQEPVLFNESIADNISYGTPEATMEQIEAAAKLANAHTFITDGTHADGYNTVVGENGFKLSGGEKQRVAIARAILRNPPILILDEATSALDNVTERQVQEALNRVMKERTVFAIAHRLSTIQNADLILVLSHGRIAEAGTHEELLALNRIYKKLHDTQFT